VDADVTLAPLKHIQPGPLVHDEPMRDLPLPICAARIDQVAAGTAARAGDTIESLRENEMK